MQGTVVIIRDLKGKEFVPEKKARLNLNIFGNLASQNEHKSSTVSISNS